MSAVSGKKVANGAFRCAIRVDFETEASKWCTTCANSAAFGQAVESIYVQN